MCSQYAHDLRCIAHLKGFCHRLFGFNSRWMSLLSLYLCRPTERWHAVAFTRNLEKRLGGNHSHRAAKLLRFTGQRNCNRLVIVNY